MHKRIGLDIDGVFADYHTAIHDVTLKKYGEVTRETLHRTECSILDTYDFDFWSKLKPLPLHRTVEDMLTGSWMDHGMTIYFLTRRPPCLQEVTTDWLDRNFGTTGREIVVCGSVEKGRLAQGLLLDIFVDDDPIHCLQVAKYSPKTTSMLYTRPGNLWFNEEGTSVIRVGEHYER